MQISHPERRLSIFLGVSLTDFFSLFCRGKDFAEPVWSKTGDRLSAIVSEELLDNAPKERAGEAAFDFDHIPDFKRTYPGGSAGVD